MTAGPAVALLGAATATALLAERPLSAGVIAALLLGACLRAPVRRRWPYLAGALLTSASVFFLSPLVQTLGEDALWTGPTVPVLGVLDVTTEEVAEAGFQALRLAAVALAFSAYALLLDHDRLLGGMRFARRFSFAAALATRLVPTLERDAAGFVEALRGRGVEVTGLRARARLLSPLVAGSLERGLSLAEAMEARGFGRARATRAPNPPLTQLDFAALAAAPVLVVVGTLWL